MYGLFDWYLPQVSFVSPASAEQITPTFIHAAATMSQVSQLRDDEDDVFI